MNEGLSFPKTNMRTPKITLLNIAVALSSADLRTPKITLLNIALALRPSIKTFQNPVPRQTKPDPPIDSQLTSPPLSSPHPSSLFFSLQYQL